MWNVCIYPSVTTSSSDRYRRRLPVRPTRNCSISRLTHSTVPFPHNSAPTSQKVEVRYLQEQPTKRWPIPQMLPFTSRRYEPCLEETDSLMGPIPEWHPFLYRFKKVVVGQQCRYHRNDSLTTATSFEAPVVLDLRGTLLRVGVSRMKQVCEKFGDASFYPFKTESRACG